MPKWLQKVLRWEPGISLGQWIYDRLANNAPKIVTGIGGLVMTYLAIITEWMRALGPGGIGAIIILTIMTIWVGIAAAQSLRAKARLRRSHSEAVDKWRQQVDGVNPLDREFHTKRLRLVDIANPINGAISEKRLIDCELLGPANLMFLGVDMKNVAFVDCDVVVVKSNFPINNALAFEKVVMLGGSIWKTTLLVPERDVLKFAQLGAKFASPTGYPEIDNPKPTNTEAKSPP